VVLLGTGTPLPYPGPNGRIPDEQLLREIQKTYHGKVVIGHDLEVH